MCNRSRSYESLCICYSLKNEQFLQRFLWTVSVYIKFFRESVTLSIRSQRIMKGLFYKSAWTDFFEGNS